MEKLVINSFKAFNEEVELDIDNKNILVYGENGAGKSSIYEAIKLVFFQEKIERNVIRASMTPEEKSQKRNDLISSYNNKIHNNPFEIRINNTNYLDFDKNQYQVFMICTDDIYIAENISLESIINNCYIDIENTSVFFNDYYDLIEYEVNRVLREDFKEIIQISIDSTDNFKCIISDGTRNLSRKENIKDYFNEAKLNLVLLLLSFATIHLSIDSSKKKILVLDDFITSMDAANRTFLINYIIKTFDDCQKIIFTHNISFYNLVIYTVNNIYKHHNKWLLFNLYEIENSHRIYQSSHVEDVDKIREDYNKVDCDIVQIGNRIRKKFEILLYELSKLLMIGAVEESKKILSLIIHGKPIYYHNNKTSIDLISEIETTLNSGNHHKLAKRIQDKIDHYKGEDLNNLKAILKKLILYQKVTMHPLSHGTIGLPPFTPKEITESLSLLKELESSLSGLVNANSTNM